MTKIKKTKEKADDLFSELLLFFSEKHDLNNSDSIAMFLAVDKLHFVMENFMLDIDTPKDKAELEMAKAIMRVDGATFVDDNNLDMRSK